MSGEVTPTNPLPPRTSLPSIYFAFMGMGAFAFGGGLTGLVYREAVERRRWVSDQEFAAGLALCQITPGTNVGNMAVYLGLHLRGPVGAAVALAGLLTLPFFIVLLVFMMYERIAHSAWLTPVMDGVTAAALGLLLRVGVRTGFLGSKTIAAYAVLAATFIMVGVLRWPLLLVVSCLAPVSVLAAWYLNRKKPDAE